MRSGDSRRTVFHGSRTGSAAKSGGAPCRAHLGARSRLRGDGPVAAGVDQRGSVVLGGLQAPSAQPNSQGPYSMIQRQ
jgi:hypothetical protein